MTPVPQQVLSNIQHPVGPTLYKPDGVQLLAFWTSIQKLSTSSAMGLTTAQRAAIQNNWSTVRANYQEFGDALFMRYLLANPGDIQYFPKFASVGVGAQLRSTEEFQQQTLTVITFLGKVVDHLEDINAAGNLLRERVRTHNPRGITMAQFERLLDLVPRFLQECAGANGPCADAWRVAVASLMPAMRDEFSK